LIQAALTWWFYCRCPSHRNFLQAVDFAQIYTTDAILEDRFKRQNFLRKPYP
jgi:hypothetical protein